LLVSSRERPGLQVDLPPLEPQHLLQAPAEGVHHRARSLERRSQVLHHGLVLVGFVEDVAVFSLSLIAEPVTRWQNDLPTLRIAIESTGFHLVGDAEQRYEFVYLTALKAGK
jgi:hypothetical protein